MIEQILAYLNNYFIRSYIDGTFDVSGGSITIDGIQDNQYFRIRDSVFNDGVYKYPTTELTDETFTGSVDLLAIPPKLLAKISEIETWVSSHTKSSFNSESFKGYSYSKKSGANGSSGDDWQLVFSADLREWRKI